MSLRRRLSLVAAAAVAVAIAIAAAACYLVVRTQLRDQVDSALRAQRTAVQTDGLQTLNQPVPGIPASLGGPAQYVQFVTANSKTSQRQGNVELPVDAPTRRIAERGSGTYMADVREGSSHFRVLTFGLVVSEPGRQPLPIAVQLARPLNGTDHILSKLRLILAVLFAGGILGAGMLGRIAARRVLAPLSEVSQTAEDIGETDDLSRRLVVHADDEVGQLATRFNTMLERLETSRAALDDSVRAQRQLVADASHELRTPVTSLRTNIEVLMADPALGGEDHHRLLADVVEQSEELTALVSDLIELARGDLPHDHAEDARLDRIVAESVARAKRNSPQVTFDAVLEPVIVEGIPERLGRAINNLLDNAARHSPPGGVVYVAVDGDGVRVRDHGSGIDGDDLAHVFDRFFRGANARGQQGSGLGLAIVRQVAEQHGGSVSAANAPDGGAIFSLHLPTQRAEGDTVHEPVGDPLRSF